MSFTNHLRVRALIAILTICLTSCATDTNKSPVFGKEELTKINEEDQALFTQALQNSKSNSNQSIENWKSYIEKHSKSYAAYNNLGVAHIYNKNLKSAIKSFKQSIKIHPNNQAKRNLVWAERRWANIKELQEQPKTAEEEVGELKTYKPMEEVLQDENTIDEVQ